LFDHNLDFITTRFTFNEVERFIPYIAKKAGVSESFVRSLLQLLPLKVFESETYCDSYAKAKSLVQDKNDADILALSLATNNPLWSNDAGFEGITEIKLIKTKDFV
ncbi:MAG: PilT protein, partial [archaeon GW2011_AR9]